MKNVLKTVYEACADKKSHNIRVLDISPLTVIADYFVLASGSNINQLRAISDHIDEQVRQKHQLSPIRLEGYQKANWILMDYGDFVVHIFDEESRSFYNLDRIWSDAKEIPMI